MQSKQIKSEKKQKSNRAIDRARTMGRTLMLPVLLVVSSVAVVYSAVLVSRLTGSIGYEEPLPDRIIRLQVVNASDNDGLMREFCRVVNGYADAQVEVHVVDSSRYKRSATANSILISRQANLEDAQRLSQMLELASDEITYKPLEFNNDLANLTLVIGNDFDMDNIHDNFSEKEK